MMVRMNMMMRKIMRRKEMRKVDCKFISEIFSSVSGIRQNLAIFQLSGIQITGWISSKPDIAKTILLLFEI